MKKLYIIAVILAILCTILILVYLGIVCKPSNVDISDIDKIKASRDSIEIEYKKLIQYTDSIIAIKNTELDSINKSKNELIINYENYIKNLSDVNIVSDDSITRYISDRIQNRR